MSKLKPLTRIEQLAIMDAVARLSDDANVNAEEAGLYLDMSERKLADLRMYGGGPRFFQAPNENSKAQNQPVKYKMRELRKWQEERMVSSTSEGAKLRGMAFGTMGDITESQPFFMKDGKIVSHSSYISKELFRDYLEDGLDVAWLDWFTAMSQPWGNPDNREIFQTEYLNLLESLKSKAEQAGSIGENIELGKNQYSTRNLEI